MTSDSSPLPTYTQLQVLVHSGVTPETLYEHLPSTHNIPDRDLQHIEQMFLRFYLAYLHNATNRRRYAKREELAKRNSNTPVTTGLLLSQTAHKQLTNIARDLAFISPYADERPRGMSNFLHATVTVLPFDDSRDQGYLDFDEHMRAADPDNFVPYWQIPDDEYPDIGTDSDSEAISDKRFVRLHC